MSEVASSNVAFGSEGTWCCSLRCGYHRGLKKTLYETLLSDPFHQNTTQIFLGPPTQLKCRVVAEDDRAKCQAFCHEHNMSFYAHCPYTLNLAKPNAQPSLTCLRAYLEGVRDLPAACILHVGRVGTINNVVKHLNELINDGSLGYSPHPRSTCSLLLEVGAGQGTELGCNWDELRHLYEGLDKSRVGLCLDTQHLFASGMSRLQTHEDVVQLFDAAYELGASVPVIHLNDSTKPFGARVDRHAPLTQGYIWRKDQEGLISLCARAAEEEIDAISETGDITSDMQVLKELGC